MFFFLHGLLLAVLTAFLGWVAMLVCLISFYKRSWIAVGFLVPAFAWKTFVVFDVLVIWFVPILAQAHQLIANS
jgi:tryptophan-rich sensory protein